MPDLWVLALLERGLAGALALNSTRWGDDGGGWVTVAIEVRLEPKCYCDSLIETHE